MNDGRTFSWPNWRTVRKIGSGGFGTVYEIEKDTAGFVEKAALKVVSIPESDSDIEDYRLSGYDDESISKRYLEALQDVVNEYRVMKELKGCPSIVICDDVQTAQHEDGIGWDVLIKMELLTPLLKKLGKEVSDLQVIQIGKDLCAALMECEKRGVLHRDIKPQNIFVSDNGTYKLGDFGIAKAVEKTTRGTQTGTYKYMAPEVYHNEPYGPRADICSLGLVLYWLLNERHEPFVPINNRPPTSSEEETARMRRLSKEMAKESLPEPKHGDELLKQVVCKACAYDPNERYQSAAEFRDALEEAESRTAGVWPSPHPVPPTPPKPPIWKWVALGAVGIALLSIIGWGLFSNHSTEETSNPANETQTEEIVDIRITNSELSLRLGEPIQITTETSADNDDLDILYQVSDETIANVTPSGVLTGLRPGTVVIEASYGEQSDSMELSFAIPDSITAEEMNETEREYLCKMIDEKASEVDASENLYEQYQEGYIDTDIGEIHFYQDKELKKNLYSMTYQAHDEEKAEKNGLLNWYGEFYLGHTVMEIFFDSSRSEVYFIHLTDKYYDRDYACYYYNGELLEIKDKSANRVYKSSEDSFVIDGWDWWSDSEIESEYGSFKFTGWADFEEDIYQFALKCCTRAQEEYSYISTYLDPNYIN